MMEYCRLPLVHLSVELSTSGENCPGRDRNLLQSHQMLCHCCAINQLAEALAEPTFPSDQDPSPLEKVKCNGAAPGLPYILPGAGVGEMRIDNLQTRAWVQIWTISCN